MPHNSKRNNRSKGSKCIMITIHDDSLSDVVCIVPCINHRQIKSSEISLKPVSLHNKLHIQINKPDMGLPDDSL